MTTPERSGKGKKKRRHVLGEGWTRYSLGDWERAMKVWLVEENENRGWQAPVPLELQLWNAKVRLVIEEI